MTSKHCTGKGDCIGKEDKRVDLETVDHGTVDHETVDHETKDEKNTDVVLVAGSLLH